MIKKDKKSFRDRMVNYHFSVYNPRTKETVYPYREEEFDIKWLSVYGHDDYYCGIN